MQICELPSPFLFFVLVLQLRDDRGIRQRRRVAERLAFGDVAQQAAHDLARARLRQVGGEDDVVRLVDGPNLARELSAGHPAATVIASHFDEVITFGKRMLRNDHFQVYGNNDLVGPVHEA